MTNLNGVGKSGITGSGHYGGTFRGVHPFMVHDGFKRSGQEQSLNILDPGTARNLRKAPAPVEPEPEPIKEATPKENPPTGLIAYLGLAEVKKKVLSLCLAATLTMAAISPLPGSSGRLHASENVPVKVDDEKKGNPLPLKAPEGNDNLPFSDPTDFPEPSQTVEVTPSAPQHTSETQPTSPPQEKPVQETAPAEIQQTPASQVQTPQVAPAPSAPVQVQETESQKTIKEAQKLGVSDGVIKKLTGGNPENTGELQKLMGETKKLFSRMKVKQRVDLYRGMNGTTSTMLGKVDNRKAFIDGEVFGVNVFSRMKENIQKQVREEEMTWEDGKQFKKDIDYCSKLKPEQREAIAEMVTWMAENMLNEAIIP